MNVPLSASKIVYSSLTTSGKVFACPKGVDVIASKYEPLLR